MRTLRVLAAQVESLLPSERSFTESSCGTTRPASLPRVSVRERRKEWVRECVSKREGLSERVCGFVSE